MSFDSNLPAMPNRMIYPDLPVPPTDFRKPMIAGLAVIGIALGGFTLWSATASLDSAVVTQGVVTVESKRKTVQHREGGIVAQVLVKEGDVVPAGTVLVRLDDSTAQAQMATLSDQFDTKTAERARLLAERDNLDAIAFPEALTARAQEPKVAEILAREQDRFSQRRATLSGQRQILEARIAQLESQHEGRSGLETSKRRQLDLLKQEIEGLRRLEAKGYYPTNKLRASERELARMEGEMLNDNAGVDQSDKEIGETRLQIMQTDQKFRDDGVAELIKVEAELSEIGQKLVAARDAVERLTIVAPVEGTVQNLKVAGKGAVVPANGEVAELVPNTDRLVIDAHVRPNDIDRVHQGQGAELRFSTFNSKTTPVINGEVAVVSADRNTDQATREVFYNARVEVPADQVSRLPGTLKAGMPVEVMLEGGSRTPLQYLTKPLLDAFARSFKER
ncbi:MAG: HlyD family type I secretion periplasmic adaptor subunit [Solirubrobacterales bacterium]